MDDTIRRYIIKNTSTPNVFKCTILQETKQYKIILKNGCNGSSNGIPTKYDYVRWHPDGLLFSYELNESEGEEEITTSEILSFTDGFLFIHDWIAESKNNNTRIPYIPAFPPVVESNSNLGIVTFILGEVSDRRIGEREKIYRATAVNAVSINYSLDADSLAGGNKINSQNGTVTWHKDWIGESTITALITGMLGTASGTHVVTTIDDTEDEPYYDEEDILSEDNYSTYRKVRVSANKIELSSDDLYYIMLKYPLDEDNDVGTVIVSTTFYREQIYEGYLTILLGVLNSVENERLLSMDWGSGGKKAKVIPPKPPVIITTRWFVISETCLLDGVGKNTGQMEVYKKKQVFNTETEEWDDMLEETTETVTDTYKCPIPQKKYFIAISSNTTAYDFTSENFMVASKENENSIKTKPKEGSNYSFISLPKDLPFTIFNSSHNPITYQFELVSGPDDIRVGYEPNQIWKKMSMFKTAASTTYTIKL